MKETSSATSYPTVRRARGSAAGGSSVAGRALRLLGIALLAVGSPSCKNFNVFTVEDDVEFGRLAYEQTLEENSPVTSGPDAEMVQRAMDRLVATLEPEEDPGYPWEVTLLEAPETVNAFALPGGKMAVYSGILPVAGSEQALAVVMGHEIGHVVERHGTERMTRALGIELVGVLVEQQEWGSLVQQGMDVLVSLPYGRDQELEADRMGLFYMARAGYDPREAIGFWKRMSEGSGEAPPEFLSTHPSDERRIQELEAALPEALEVWRNRTGPRP